ncbi:glycerate kinase [Alteribacillus sp. YIM 98480]|uniref:glycerate kinase n=1 Tax=Alteribacillus sp. YIM 98480 TaxID=2606599 RepID=UPI00131AAB95|nr:glycerate kinase [Alteribacillus sp. YIM 98480]
MKIVIAPDSFKGSLSAIQAAESIKRGINNVSPDLETVLVPCADGGEGTMETIVKASGGEIQNITVTGPLGEPVRSGYGLLGDKKTCVIEMATAAGLDLVDPEQLNPLSSTTYGVGELIKAALDDGYRNFIVTLGGSATNDGGAGMLQALGASLLNKDGKEIAPGGEGLKYIYRLEMSKFDKRIKECNFTVASDVQNPFVGPEGASHVFGPQKGATPTMVRKLDENMTKWADVIAQETNFRIHDMPGAGAAGGMGGALLAFFQAEIQQGIEVIVKAVNLEQALVGAEMVITGEGQVDFQTAFGKTPMGVARVAQKQGIPTVVIAGSVGNWVDNLYEHGIHAVHSMVSGPMTLNEAMDNAEKLIERSAEQIVRTVLTLLKA